MAADRKAVLRDSQTAAAAAPKDTCNNIVCGITNTVASVVRPPDYFAFDASFSPIPFAPFIQVGGNITSTRDGKLYLGPEVGPGVTGAGGSVRAGWIDQLHQPSKTYTDDFIGGPSLTGSGYVPVVGVPGLVGVGPSSGEQWGNEGQLGWRNFSTEVGVGCRRRSQRPGDAELVVCDALPGSRVVRQ